MIYLLDTQAIILAANGSLPRSVRDTLDESQELFYSMASIWEIGLKAAKEKLVIQYPLPEFVRRLESELSCVELLITPGAIAFATAFPFHHLDPFDRLLIGQAKEAKAVIVGSDRMFDAYGVARLWE